MKIYLVWSGSRSKEVAEILGEWLHRVIETIEPLILSDIEKDTFWKSEIVNILEELRIGIICLTPENLSRNWLLFEAGALSRMKDIRVYTFLLGLSPADVKGPLGQFQHIQIIEDDILKLLHEINQEVRRGDEHPLTEDVLNSVFEDSWSQLEEDLCRITEHQRGIQHQARDNREILEEILELVRAQKEPSELVSKCTVNLLDRKGRDIELGDPVERILNAKKEVWITGTTLNVARSGAWRGFEDTDAKIKVILPDFTRDSIMEATAITDNRISKNIPYESGLEEQRRNTKESWEFFNSSETKAGRVEVKLLPYSPCYSIFAVDADYACKADGYISVEIIGYHYKPSLVPNFLLSKCRNGYSKFYNLLLSMWNEMWADSFSFDETGRQGDG